MPIWVGSFTGVVSFEIVVVLIVKIFRVGVSIILPRFRVIIVYHVPLLISIIAMLIMVRVRMANFFRIGMVV